MPARARAARPHPRIDLTPRIGVALVHWNQPARLGASVAAFRAQSVEVELVVVDNGSRPADLARVAVEAPGIPVVELGRNTGFGPGANAGLRWGLDRAHLEYLVVAPHDALPAPDCLERIVAELDTRSGAGLACADVGDGHIPVVDPYFGGMTIPASRDEGWEAVHYPHGTLLVARRTCLLDIGLFDDAYFAYCEEADLGIRARRAGWDIGLVHGARVVNPTMRSGSAAVDYLMQRNTIFLVHRWFGRYHATIRFLIALIDLVRGTFGWGPPQFLYAPRARVRALVDVLRGQWGPPPKRYFEQLDERGNPE